MYYDVSVEHPLKKLDQVFTYQSDLDIAVGCRVKVPFAYQELVGVVVKQKITNDSGYEAKNILEVLDDEPYYNDELFALAKYMSYRYVASEITCLKVMLPSKLKPQSNYATIKKEAWVKVIKEANQLTNKQQIAYDSLKKQTMPRSEYYEKYKSAGKKLIELGIVAVYYLEAKAKIESLPQEKMLPLTPMQQQAYQRILNSQKEVCLLHGVCGSGKSEVYLQLAHHYMKQGKQVLLLVSEISLTPMLCEKVKSRFQNKVAIYHSALNDQEKYEQYRLVKNKEVNIVVGTRSAVFMPFDHLGLIVMDEEHETSYKQDRTPKYHTRDIALFRVRYHKAKLLLCSATPSLESYARAYKGNYELVTLNQRINESKPKIQLINMREEIMKYHDHLLSNRLKQAITVRLQAKEQVILLLNRRGYSNVLRCLDCGYVHKCNHCDLAMSYHKEENVMKCHVCHEIQPRIYLCPKCGSKHFRYSGSGTQKLQEHIQMLFPQAKILRMDHDTTTKKGSHQKILKKFEKQEADILLGTQMIAKGLDFENVTLVGILNGDAMLSRSDYRSCELTYHLLEQASGRSGRGSKNGEVMIQTYEMDHYAITSVIQQQYLNFFQNEMHYRHLANYPPYCYMISLVCSHENISVVEEAMYAMLQHLNGLKVKVLGPASLLKKKDKERMRIIIKGKDQLQLIEYARMLYEKYYESKQKATLEIDVDPLYLE